MTIRNDRWIRKMALEHGMIEPFEPSQVRDGTISYGVSSYGYDIRVAPEFKVFTNVHNVVVDPKVFDERSFVDVQADSCIIPPNSFALARTLEYFRVPRDTLVLCVGKSTYARCFHGGTRVALVDGTAPTLEEMARRADDGEMFWGYALDRFGRIVLALLDAPRYVGRDSLVGITLDNDEEILCTPDHEFVRRDGRVAPAADLRPGDSLMPLVRRISRGYEVLYQPLNGHLEPTHRLADEWNVRNGIYAESPGMHRHHRDHDRRNDNLWNIKRTDAGAQITTQQPERALHPRNHEIRKIRELGGDHDVFCLTVPEAGNFALHAGVFTRNCGIIVNVTPLEPTWRGYLTLEISNTTPLPAKIYANEGIAQLIFFQSDEEPETAYADRKGKYQDQRGVTLPKL